MQEVSSALPGQKISRAIFSIYKIKINEELKSSFSYTFLDTNKFLQYTHITWAMTENLLKNQCD
jgi:hypothetical protein